MMKPTLCDGRQSGNCSIPEAAAELGVSNATIRNWIKTGLLSSPARNCVSQESVNHCKTHEIGATRLVARANKSKKATHDHQALVKRFLKRLDSADFEEGVVDEYENSLSESFRNQQGIFYTPASIVDDMLRGVPVTEATTFLDPCCGCGNFIVGAIRRGVRPENVWGFDTDAVAVEITRRRVQTLTGTVPPNIFCADFLAHKCDVGGFDLVFTNPPWGKKLPKDEKQRLAALYGCQPSVDTCALFTIAAFNALAPRGQLGFLYPEAVLNISTFEELRHILLGHTMLEVKNYGRPFRKVLSEACSVIVRKEMPAPAHMVDCFDGKPNVRLQNSFLANPKRILNIWATGEEQEVIETLYALPHTSLASGVNWGLGIVTGDNKNKCHLSQAPGLVPVFRGKDITPSGFGHPSLFINPDLTGCQQVAPEQIYLAPEKLVYRFISNKLVFHCDTGRNLVLNSANILVPEENFPISGPRLASLLNSQVMNWMFDKIFHTHKVLRGDLEMLPIFTSCFDGDIFNNEKFLLINHIKSENGTLRLEKTNM